MIKNLKELRETALQSLTDLKERKIDIKELDSISTMCETVMKSLRIEMDYSDALGVIPKIDFLQECHKNQGQIIKGKVETKKLMKLK